MKSEKRKKLQASKKARKEAAMKNPGGVSKYAQKAKWLARHGLFGFQVPEPKPWRGSE